MKRCPECRRDYYDDTLNFCLDDGNRLLDGPVTDDEMTIRMGRSSSGALGNGVKTKIMDGNIPSDILPEKTNRKFSEARLSIAGVYRKKIVLGTIVVLIFGMVGLGAYKALYLSAPANHFMLPQNLKMVRLTTSGNVSDITISPDGKYVAYVIKDEGKQTLRLRQTATTSDVEIVPDDGTQILTPTFTPDGNYIYFVKYDGNFGTLFQIPALGGQARKIVSDVDSAAAVSPNGKQIVFIRATLPHSLMILANADGSNQQTLVELADDEAFGTIYSVPSWSPDGKMIASAADIHEDGKLHRKLISVDAVSGIRGFLSDRNWSVLNGLSWLKDGNLIVSGNEETEIANDPVQLWLVAPNTSPKRLTNDLNNYFRASVTANGDAMVTLQRKRMANLWIAPTNDTQRAAQVANASEIGNGFEWTPDGNLIFDSSSGDNFGIWVMHSDGTNLKRVSGNLGAYFFPQVTPDNRSIVFELAREGGRSVWKMEIDGSNAKQLTDAQVRRRMCLSSDGRWVLFETIEDNAPRILKVSIDGGTAVPLAPRGPFRPIVSPQDGLIAYLSMENEMNAKVQVHFISPDGVLPHKTIELSQSVVEAVSMSFTPDGKELAYIDSRNGSSNIWTIRIDGKGEAKPLTDFKTDGISNFAWSPDGKRLAIVRGTTISDAVFINESK